MDDKREFSSDSRPAHPDPISKEPGPHPVSTGIGSAGGVVTGTVVGAAVGGPIGAVVGGAIGAVVGATAGHALGEAVNPTIEREYWDKNFRDRPYYRPGMEYSHYEPAYRLGWESAQRPEYQGKQFEDVEPELKRSWSVDLGAADPWTDAREATRDAWLRVRTQ